MSKLVKAVRNEIEALKSRIEEQGAILRSVAADERGAARAALERAADYAEQGNALECLGVLDDLVKDG